jgi:hypothetical protein
MAMQASNSAHAVTLSAFWIGDDEDEDEDDEDDDSSKNVASFAGEYFFFRDKRRSFSPSLRLFENGKGMLKL